ncbi:MAG: enhanced intracellular survival protein Eis [Promethearchaeota archaeon]
MEIRKLTKEDMTQVVKLHQYAYGFWTDQDVRDEDYTHMIPENILGLFEGDTLLTVLTIMRTQQSIRGVLKSMGGISMVGTYPEARMKGYVRTIMQSAFLEMKETGLSVSMLEPFRESFYSRLGYVPAHEKFRLKAPFDGLRIPPDDVIGESWVFERVPGHEAKDTYMTFIQEFAPKAFHGYAFNPEIRDEEWNRRNKNRLFVFIKKAGKVEALARYQIKGYMHFDESGELIVEEMYWRTLPAKAALFNYLGKHRDQVQTLRMIIPYGVDFQHWFEDLRDWIELKVWHPWMVRVVDVKEALMGLPVTTDGELVITVIDPQCGWNNGNYVIQTTNGRFTVKTTKRAAKLESSIHGLSALVYGTHSIEALEYAGWIKGVTQSTRELLGSWFPQLPLYNPYNY